MKNISKKIVLGLLTAAAIAPAAGQELRTSYFMQTSNFRHQMNPALLDSAYFSIPFLGNINFGTTGNIGLADFVFPLSGSTEYTHTTFMSPTVSADEFLSGLHDKNRADIYYNWNIFSVGFRAFGGVNLVEMNLRSNTNISLPYELFEFAKTAGAKEQYDLSDIGVRSQNYMEVALGHTRAINDKLTVGAKLKLLFGLAYADFSVDQLNLTMNGDQWRIQGNAQLKMAALNSSFSYETEDKNSDDGRQRVDGLDDTTFGMPGFGLAFDFGATYKLTEDLTLSAGLTDLGFISWSNVLAASSMGDYTFDGFDNIYTGGTDDGTNKLGDQFDALGDDLEDMFAVYDDGKTSHSQALAATLNIGAEYTLPVYRPLRFGFLYTSRISGIYSYHQAMLSANVRPLKWVEASLNTAVSSTGWTMGAMLSLKAKHFNIYLASDRFIGKVSSEFIPLHNLNSSINFGMTIPL